MATSIALSRRQKVFAVLETTPGTLAFPTAADFIRPAGDATINQTPGFTDSQEKADTLDILDQFNNALPPGDWTCPMYLRMKDFTTKPQGSNLLQSLLGGYQASAAVTALLSADLTIGGTSLTFDTLAGGVLPPTGVITIGTEKIMYSGTTMATATTGTLSNLTRGYAGTTAATHATDAVVTLTSQVYYPTTDSPSFTLWVMTDYFVQYLTGATCNNATVAIKNEDGVMFNLKGQGMQMGFASEDALAAAATSGATSITVEDSDKYTVGARIYNITKADYATAGYEITAIVGDVLTITPGIALGGGWADGDKIGGFLPDPGAMTTEVLENKDTSVKIGGVAGKLRTTDITIDTPKNYLSDEVGTTFVSEYVDDMRKVTFNMNSYFLAEKAGIFKTAKDAVETSFEVIYGNTAGKTASIYMPRTKMSVPTINFENPTVSLNTTATALGTQGEDSVYIVLL